MNTANQAGASQTVPSLPTRVLNGVSIFNIHASVWSCGREVQARDLKIDENKLPSKSIRSRSMGRKYIFDRARLKLFHGFVSEAKRILLAVGFEDAIGYIVPADKETECSQQLKEVETAFQNAWRDLYNNYYDLRDAYIESCVADPENADYEALIREGLLGREEAMGRTFLKCSCHRIAPPDVSDPVAVEIYNGLKESLAGSLLNDIVHTASTAFHDDLLGRTKAHRGILAPFNRIYKKLIGLAPLLPEAVPVMDMITEAVATIPRKGVIEGPSLNSFKWLIHILSDADRLRYYGTRILEGSRTARHVVEEGMRAKDDDSLTGIPQPLELHMLQEEEAEVDELVNTVTQPKKTRVINI